MSDIFGRVDQVHAGGLSADSLFMSWPGLPNNGMGLLIQNVGLQYNQQVRRIFELGPGALPGGGNGAVCDFGAGDPNCAARAQLTYYVTGRPQGALQIARVFGPSAIGEAFYRVYGNPCNSSSSLSLSATAGCLSAGAVKQFWIMRGVIIENLGMNVSANDSVLNEQTSGQFVSMNLVVS